MKKIVLITILTMGLSNVFAQTADSVSMGSGSPSYPYDVYYDLSQHQKDTVSNTNWHLAFALRPAMPPNNTMQSTTIRANHGRNVTVLNTNKTVANWNTVIDTTGMSTWPSLNNSNQTWDIGAFNADHDQANPFDYGWGQYDMTSHNVLGSKLYVLAIGSTSKVYKKMTVNAIVFDSLWIFTIANLDGTDSVTQAISKGAYGKKLFVYYNAITKTIIDREPNHPWDLLFTYYKDTATFAPLPVATYPFMGVLAAPQLSIGRVKGIPKTTSDTSNVINYSRNIGTLGWDWKRVYFGPPPSGPYDMTDSLSYFIKRDHDSAEVFKFYFTGFNNTPVNNITFNSSVILTHVGLPTVKSNFGSLAVYPNPATDQVNIDLSHAGSGMVSTTLVDLTGKQIATSVQSLISGTAKINLPLEGVRAGIYFVSVTTSNGTEVRKLIVN